MVTIIILSSSNSSNIQKEINSLMNIEKICLFRL